MTMPTRRSYRIGLAAAVAALLCLPVVLHLSAPDGVAQEAPVDR